MPTIPMGNFGQAVARPAAPAQIQQTDPAGQAATRAIQTAQSVVADMTIGEANERRREQQIAEAEARQQAREDEREARRVREAAIRAQSARTLATARDALTDAHDETANGVVDGGVDKTKADGVFAERAGKIIGEAGSDLPPDQRAVIQDQLQRDASRFGNSIRKAVTLRDRQDVTVGIDGQLEYAQRLFRTNPEAANRIVADTLAALGPHSTYTPQQIQAKGQAWREQTQFTAAFERISAAKNSHKALGDARAYVDGLPDLDPQKRAGLIDRIDGYGIALQQKAEIEAARRQREQEARLRQAEALYKVGADVANRGGQWSPEFTDRLLAGTAGTPFQAGIKMLAEQARNNAVAAVQPLAVQRQQLEALKARQATNSSPELLAEIDRRTKVLNANEQAVKTDPLGGLMSVGLAPEFRPLDFTGGMPGVMQQLQDRAPLAQRTAAWSGGPPTPVTAAEADQIRTMLDTLGPKERSGFINSLASAVGPQAAQGMARLMDGKGDKAYSLAFRYADARTTGATNIWGTETTAPRFTSELILKGAQAMADGSSTKNSQAMADAAATKWRGDLALKLDGVFLDPRIASDTVDAALYVKHAIALEKGAKIGSDDTDRAIAFAVRGTLVDRGSKGKTVIPAGMSEAAFEVRLAAIQPKDLGTQQVIAGGVRIPAAEFAGKVAATKLMVVRPGQYIPIVGDRPVLNDQGTPLVIQVGN